MKASLPRKVFIESGNNLRKESEAELSQEKVMYTGRNQK
jgi:hypothetical protein